MLQNRIFFSPVKSQLIWRWTGTPVTCICVCESVGDHATHMCTHEYLTHYTCQTVELHYRPAVPPHSAVGESRVVRVAGRRVSFTFLSHPPLLSKARIVIPMSPTSSLLLCLWQTWSLPGIRANTLIEDLCICSCSEFALWSKESWLGYTDVTK